MKICPKCKHKCEDYYLFCPGCDFHMENVPVEEGVEETTSIKDVFIKNFKYIVMLVIISAVLIVLFVVRPFEANSCQNNGSGSASNSPGTEITDSSNGCAGSIDEDSSALPSEDSTSEEPSQSGSTGPSASSNGQNSDANATFEAAASSAPQIIEAESGSAVRLYLDGDPVYFAKRKSDFEKLFSSNSSEVDTMLSKGTVSILDDYTGAKVIDILDGAVFVDILSGDLSGSVGYVSPDSLRAAE